jgi:hypothetical protein
MRDILFRGKRVDGEWIEGNLFVPNQLVRGIYICPETTYANFYPEFEDGDKLDDHVGGGISLGHFYEVIPETVEIMTDSGRWKNIKDVKIS